MTATSNFSRDTMVADYLEATSRPLGIFGIPGTKIRGKRRFVASRCNTSPTLAYVRMSIVAVRLSRHSQPDCKHFKALQSESLLVS